MPWLLLLLVVASLGFPIADSVSANSCAPPREITAGFLDDEEYDTIAVPRNVAVLGAGLVWTRIPLEVPLTETPLPGLSRPQSPLDPNVEIRTDTGREYDDQTARTTESIDNEAPTAVELLGVFDGGCDRSLTVDFEERPTDDQDSSWELAYAVYVGATKEEAETGSQPSGIWAGGYGIRSKTEGSWIAISVLDLAGNESPRSNAVEIMSRPAACAANGRGGIPMSFLVAISMALLALRSRVSPRRASPIGIRTGRRRIP
ncbi:MAG: hypothetical protein WBG86_16595 [Polyangiales bacterium]